MNRLVSNFRQHLSLRLGLMIVLVVTVAFSLLFGYLFFRCRQYIQRVAINHASQILDNSAERINGVLAETEAITNFMASTSPRNMTPDSLRALTRQMVEKSTVMQGFTIALEPNVLPHQGERFTVYSYRTADSLISIEKNDYNYFDDPWYETPVNKKTGCWLEPYQYTVPGIDKAPAWYFSYTIPFYDSNGRLLGVSCADLSLRWLSQAVTDVKPFPHSSAIMVGHDGRYIVHPDTAKLIRESIFSDADPRVRNDITTMGRAMLAGRSGMLETIVDDNSAFIFYDPLERTGWSIALVCPESDVFSRYNRLSYAVIAFIVVGQLLLLLFCYQIVRRAIQPLRQLDQQARHIADGQFDSLMPLTQRRDSIGRLTNSFFLMQQSLATSVNDIRRVNQELEQRNDELTKAYHMTVETNRKKAEFIKDMYHEIRTPLNIISGFAQVLSASIESMPDEDVEDITARMKQSAGDISRLTRELSEAAKPTNTI